MARRLGALGVVLAIAGLFLLLVRDRTQPHPRAPRPEDEPAAKPPAPEADGPGTMPLDAAEPAPGRATVSGTVRYPDGAPAVGRHVGTGEWRATTDDAGVFRFPDVEPGDQWLDIDDVPLASGFHVAAGEVRKFDLVIARGGVCGFALDAGTGEPIEGIDIEIFEDRARRMDALFGFVTTTDRRGRFERRGIPPGTCTLAARDTAPSRGYSEPLSAYEAQAVECHVGASDVDLTLRLRRARPMQVRFVNVPASWRPELRFALLLRDRSGRIPPLWRAPLGLDDGGRLKTPAPPPGEYDLVVCATGRWPIPWLSQPLSVPVGPVPEQTIRLPDGAPVVIESPALPGEGGFFLRIGPILVFENAVEEFRVPYVPEGRHEIWRLFPACEVRVGEVIVTAGREVRLAIPKGGTATLRGRPDPYGDGRAELRDTHGDVVARQEAALADFAFGLLPAGSYVLEIGDRRFPVTLAEGEDKDLGILRGPGGTSTRR